METKSRKFGWTEKGIVGIVFAPMGLIFLALALILPNSSAVEPEDRTVFLIVFGAMGAAFLLTGLILLRLDLRRRSRLRTACEDGICVQARIAEFRTNNRVNLNGMHPTVAECHWTDPDTGIVHVYFSRYLYVHVEDLVKGQEVPLYLNRDDPSVGYVDIDAVLPEIRVHR